MPASQHEAHWGSASLTNSSFHDDYRPLDQILEFMTELSTSFPDLVKLVPIGHSAEQRDMLAMEISKENTDTSRRSLKQKQGIIIMGAQHAREVCHL